MNQYIEKNNERTVIVRGEASGFVKEIIVGRHHMTADEPVGDGGTDQEASPYDFLLAALVA
jgi:uncharacterized OsmC-like protein